ncbi:MAG: SCO family protein [Nitrospinota bacterium]
MGKGFKGALWAALALGVIGWVGFGLWSLKGDEGDGGLPTYSSVPDFSLVERTGGRISRADLLNTVWVADFFYTQCPDTCPLQTAEMAHLQGEFASEKQFRLVSFTIDPERDTPEVLTAYAKKFGADSERWLFLTGKKREIYDLVRNGFRLSVAVSEEPHGPASLNHRPQDMRPGESPSATGRVRPVSAGGLWHVFLRMLEASPAWAHHPADVDSRFTHSSRFVLVDRKADIRGYYHSDDAEVLKRLRRDVRKLLPQN